MANGRSRINPSYGFTHVSERFISPQWLRRPAIPSFSKAEFFGSLLANFLQLVPKILSIVCPQRLAQWLKWCPTSAEKLETAEHEVLSYLKQPYKGELINIGKCCDKDDSFIRTISLNWESKKTPLVLLHGFGCGIGVWIMNLDSLANTRPVYAVDLLGFGRSSRPEFSSDSLESEMQFFISLEKWRMSIGLEKFILLGHSLGGYIAASYALHYPDRIAMLVLVDPWGLPEKPISLVHSYDMDSWVKFCDSFLRGFNFLASVRASGPVGPFLVSKFRSDLSRKYGQALEDPQCIIDYIYHCNVQTPSGEAAFKAMTDAAGWAVNPMMYRLNSLDLQVPITFVYGSRSWVNRQPGLQIKYSRLNSYVDVQVVEGSGHHVYADKPKQFNDLINAVCEDYEKGLC